MTIHVIHNPARTDRKELLDSVIQQHNLTVRFWPALFHATHTFEGISRAHKQIVFWAKHQKLPCVCIAEDDFYITAKGGWEYFIQNIPSDYDLYLASVYFGHIEEDKSCKDFCGLTLYIVHERFYDMFLSAKEFGNLDRTLSEFSMAGNALFKVCEPFVALQREGIMSDNTKTISIYRRYLIGRRIFGQPVITAKDCPD